MDRNDYPRKPPIRKKRGGRRRSPRRRRERSGCLPIGVLVILCVIVGSAITGKIQGNFSQNDFPIPWQKQDATPAPRASAAQPTPLPAPGETAARPVSAPEAHKGKGNAQGASIVADITAPHVFVMDADSGSILYEKNSADPIAPASTVKILAALTVLDYYAPKDALTVGKELDLVAADASKAWLNRGDRLTVKQLLVALLLPSGNDAAYTLAVNPGRKIAADESLSLGKSVKTFMHAVNQKAQDVGATHSHFIKPDGYDAQGQYTTAHDLALIAKASLNNRCLAEIMGKYKIHDTWLSGREVTYTNTNELLNSDSAHYYAKAIGQYQSGGVLLGVCGADSWQDLYLRAHGFN